MTPSSFFEHFGILENPFRGEEARQDAVFTRLVLGPRPSEQPDPLGGASGSVQPFRVIREGVGRGAQHPELERIAGDLHQIASSVVFGEKGSGKTAIRLQLAHAVSAYNARNAEAKVLLVPYDDLNPVLDRLHNRLRRLTRKGETPPAESLKQIRLVDHIDGLLSAAVPRLVDSALSTGLSPSASGPEIPDVGPEPRKALKRADQSVKRDLLILQAIYDRAEDAVDRTRQLRRAMGVKRSLFEHVSSLLALWGWILPMVVVLLMVISSPGVPPTSIGSGDASTTAVAQTTLQVFWDTITSPTKLLGFLGLSGWSDSRTVVWSSLFFLATGIWLVFLIRRGWSDRFRLSRLAHRLHRQIRVSGRSEGSIAESIRQIPGRWRSSSILPVTDSEDQRMRMLQRLRGVLALFGYRSIVAVIDRVDEPSLVSGDADRMRSVVWPLMNNKFLQQEGVAIKMLLPIELRHMLFRESAAFFQQARMDKQNLVEQLSWTGSMLFDLCTARMTACRAPRMGAEGSEPITLADLFEENVGREMLVEALEQMRQPRDAFKLVYQCIMEHCAVALEGAGEWRINKRILELVKKQQAERVRQLAMGIRPA